MRFEFIGKTKTVLEDIDIQSLKMGQTETVPAAALKFTTKKANTFLDALDPTGALRRFFYEKNGNAAKVQKQLEGVEVITDLPQLRQAGVRLGALHWEDEQTGCKLSIDHGLGGPSNITLKDSTVNNFKLVPKDGGTTQVFFTVYSTDIDHDSMGSLCLLHQHDVQIELTAPEIIRQQKTLTDEEEQLGTPGDGKAGGTPLTPEAALAASAKRDAKPAANTGRVKRRA